MGETRETRALTNGRAVAACGSLPRAFRGWVVSCRVVVSLWCVCLCAVVLARRRNGIGPNRVTRHLTALHLGTARRTTIPFATAIVSVPLPPSPWGPRAGCLTTASPVPEQFSRSLPRPAKPSPAQPRTDGSGRRPARDECTERLTLNCKSKIRPRGNRCAQPLANGPWYPLLSSLKTKNPCMPPKSHHRRPPPRRALAHRRHDRRKHEKEPVVNPPHPL